MIDTKQITKPTKKYLILLFLFYIPISYILTRYLITFCNTFQTALILNFNIYFVVILCLGSKNDNFEESILKELREPRSIALSTVNEDDGDLNCCKFVTSLMKNLTK